VAVIGVLTLPVFADGLQTRPAPGSDAVGLLLRSMQLAAERLMKIGDPGPGTQRFQRQALQQLKALAGSIPISADGQSGRGAAAKGRIAESKTASAAARTSQGVPSGREGGRRPGGPGGAGAVRQSVSSTAETAVESGLQWGFLPANQREQIVQGMSQPVLPRYRKLVSRYWLILSRIGRER